MKLVLLPGRFAVCKLGPNDAPPARTPSGSFYSVTRTDDETSVVCEETAVGPTMQCETGWRVIKIDETLDFSLTGVLNSLAAPLTKAGISVFAVSTFTTDYVLVKEADIADALECLRQEGFTTREP